MLLRWVLLSMTHYDGRRVLEFRYDGHEFKESLLHVNERDDWNPAKYILATRFLVPRCEFLIESFTVEALQFRRAAGWQCTGGFLHCLDL
jgi:hypothetical protein